MEPITFATLTAITLGLVQVAKKTGLATRYAPLFSLFVGVAISMIMTPDVNGLIQGIVVALTASGLWSGTKTTISK